jgi:hypothetical protein
MSLTILHQHISSSAEGSSEATTGRGMRKHHGLELAKMLFPKNKSKKG